MQLTTEEYERRLAEIRARGLASGSHDTREDGMCAMEADAYLAGMPHSDCPPCTCPVIAAYVRKIDDRLRDDERQRLIEYLPLHKRAPVASREVQVRRAMVLADHAVRRFAVRALRLSGQHEDAAKLAVLPQIVDRGTAEQAWTAAEAAYGAAYAAADAYAAYGDAVASSASHAAAYAAYAASYAASYAADAASYDSSYAAYGAAYAARAAAYVTDAASHADATDAERTVIVDMAFGALDDVLAIQEAA